MLFFGWTINSDQINFDTTLHISLKNPISITILFLPFPHTILYYVPTFYMLWIMLYFIIIITYVLFVLKNKILVDWTQQIYVFKSVQYIICIIKSNYQFIGANIKFTI